MGIAEKYEAAWRILVDFVKETAKEKKITQQQIADHCGWK